ncbi:MAG TPA: DUF1634 domain-containing protein [Silvibacterium sp.]|jgi:uncharacterized membrane protein|nr:DUF1634 domain-containing protein [Silvibacterium sp.]
MQLTDQKLEVAIGRMLQTGVLLAAAVVLIGGVLYLRQETGPRPDYSHFTGVAESLRSPEGIVTHAVHGDPQSIIQLGLLLLIATPIARVVLAAAGFLIEKDHLYFWVSVIVFAVLLYSLMHAF